MLWYQSIAFIHQCFSLKPQLGNNCNKPVHQSSRCNNTYEKFQLLQILYDLRIISLELNSDIFFFTNTPVSVLSIPQIIKKRPGQQSLLIIGKPHIWFHGMESRHSGKRKVKVISSREATEVVIAMVQLRNGQMRQERLTDLLWSCGWGCWKGRDCPNTNGLWIREEGGFAAWSKMEGAGRLGRDWMEFNRALSWSPAVGKTVRTTTCYLQKGQK